jgi:hypothetical protein
MQAKSQVRDLRFLMPIKRLGLVEFFAFIIGGILVFIRGSFVGDPGIGWHIKTGELIDSIRNVPRTDPFLFPTEGKHWVSNQWLSDYIIWDIYNLGGWHLLHIMLVGFILSIYVAILFPLLKKYCNSNIAVFFALFISALLGSVQWFLRPVIFSVFFFALVYKLIYQWHDADEHNRSNGFKKLFVFLPIIFIVWANMHPAFPLGLLIIIFAGIGILLGQRDFSQWRRDFLRAALLFIISSAATIINPYGLELHKSALGLVGDSYFMNLNAEWFSPDFYDIFFVPLLMLILILLFARAVIRNSFSVFDLLLCFVFLFLSIQQRRYIPFFGIASSVFLVKSFSELGTYLQKYFTFNILSRISRQDRLASTGQYFVSAWVIILVYTLIFGHIPFRSTHNLGISVRNPDAALEAIRSSNYSISKDRQNRIFHTPDWGGFITFKLWPEYKAFIDDRNELNGSDVYEEFFTLDRVKFGWQEVIQKYDFHWLLLEAKSPLVQVMGNNPNWALYYRDDMAVVFRR